MRKATVIAVGLIVLIFIVLAAGTTFFTDWLWFKSLGFTGVFWTSFLTNWAVRLSAFAVTFAFLFVNFALALRAFKRLRPQEEGVLTQLQQLGDLPLPWLNVAASAVLAFLISSALNPGWAAVQQFLHPVKVGIADPVLKLDVGYYLFRFPILQSLNGLAQSLAWLTLLGVGAVYWMSQAFWRQGNSYVLWPQAKTHLTILAALLFLAKIWGYTLARQGLLLKDTGLLTGVDYTANAIRLPVYNLLALIAAACIVLLIISLYRRGLRLFLAGVILLFGSSFVLGGIAPGLVQASGSSRTSTVWRRNISPGTSNLRARPTVSTVSSCGTSPSARGRRDPEPGKSHPGQPPPLGFQGARSLPTINCRSSGPITSSTTWTSTATRSAGASARSCSPPGSSTRPNCPNRGRAGSTYIFPTPTGMGRS